MRGAKVVAHGVATWLRQPFPLDAGPTLPPGEAVTATTAPTKPAGAQVRWTARLMTPHWRPVSVWPPERPSGAPGRDI